MAIQRLAGVRPELAGPARLGRRTKDLVKRLQPGDIAVIDHRDLDRVAADGLVAARVQAVVNVNRSISGRYPNGGPLRLATAGIPLIDEVDGDLFDRVPDGDVVTVADGRVVLRGEVVGKGRVLDVEEITRRMEEARVAIGAELEQFATNTLEYIQREAQLTFGPIVLPELRTRIQGRQALVVVRGHDYRDDLRALRAYIREFRPVLIGVDGGADALLEIGYRPDIIIGDFDSVSEAAIATEAELIHHVHLDGRAPGREELRAWGVPYEEFVVDGTSEDAAMLLAYEAGAQLIVAVGTHATMVEFLDKGRAGMSSTFLTRLRLGPILVDAKGVSRLYEGRLRKRDVLPLVLAALFAIIVVTIVSEPLQVFLDGVRLTLRDLWLSATAVELTAPV